MRPLLALLIAAAVLPGAGLALAKASHAGWPTINGAMTTNKTDSSGTMNGTDRNDELLGGHGDDTISGGAGDDVIWGDFHPSGQPETQVDTLSGGPGNEFIYASHGRNVIDAGPGNDTIHAHFGRGTIDCGPGTDLLFVSHRSKRVYKIRGCERISFKTE